MAEHSSTEPVGPEDVASEPGHRVGRAGRGKHRRVTTPPPPGSDPEPSPEPPRHASTENDEQLRRDKPPHWG